MNDDLFGFGTDFFDLELDNRKNQEKLRLKEGELREVTMLFADIRGFTNLSTHYQPEVIHDKMDEIMKIFSRCITFYGGFVDKYMGDGIMALFGAKKATEQDTERAILAALKMQQQLRLYNSLLNRQEAFRDVTLGLRIGINTGLVSVGKVGESREGDFTVYGPEVNLASRMESNAPVNEIMLPFKTMQITEHIFEFEPRGPISVKGIEEAVDCWLVRGIKKEKTARWQKTGQRFIGRDHELETMRNLYSSILNSPAEPRTTFAKKVPMPILCISADAGLGKTRLVYEFERSLISQYQSGPSSLPQPDCCEPDSSAPLFIHAACNGISSTPLNLFTGLLESIFQIRISEATEIKTAKLKQGFSSLAANQPESAAELNDAFNPIAFLLEIKTEDPRLKQSGKDLLLHLIQACETVLTQYLSSQQGRPVLLVLDDLHWIDEASVLALAQFIRQLSSRQSSLSCLLILLYRPDFDPAKSILKDVISTRIDLLPFSREEIRQLLTSYTIGLDIPPQTEERVIALSAGNPFYLEEWCNFINDLPQDDLHEMPVPANLHALILSRLDKLAENLRLLLQKASVIGQEFFIPILRAVEEQLHDTADVEVTLSALEQEALIMKLLGFDLSTYFFKHITTREVAYQTLLMANRKMLHQLTGEAIEMLFADRLDEFYFPLAIHFQKAEITEKARNYTHLAAQAAARIYNNSQAIALYEQLLAYIPADDHASRADTLIRIADIKWLIGAWQEGEDLSHQALDLANAAHDAATQADAQRFLGIACFQRGDMEQAKAHFEGVLAIAEEQKDKKFLCIGNALLGVWHQHHREFDRALVFHQLSLSLSEEIAEPQRSAKTLSNIGLIYMELDDFPKAEEMFQNCLKIAEEHKYQKEISIALGNLGVLKLYQDLIPEAEQLLNAKLALARKMDDKYEQIKALGNLGNIQRDAGNPDIALSFYRQILALRQQIGDKKGMALTQKVIAEEEKKLKNTIE